MVSQHCKTVSISLQRPGTGLGLSISYDIVTQQHGGTIEVESRVGEFTEFTIRLPTGLRADAALSRARSQSSCLPQLRPSFSHRRRAALEVAVRRRRLCPDPRRFAADSPLEEGGFEPSVPAGDQRGGSRLQTEELRNHQEYFDHGEDKINKHTG
jgi:hypothetical protein